MVIKQNENLKDNEFLKKRTILFEGDFNKDNCRSLKEQLLYLYELDTKADITIYISSHGGGLHYLLSIMSLISSLKCKIITIALGYCMSAGAYLLLLGDERYSYQYTRIMLHELAWEGTYKKLHDKEKEFKESEEIQQLLNNILSNKTKIKNINEFLKDEQYMTPLKALELGVIDKIIGEEKWT